MFDVSRRLALILWCLGLAGVSHAQEPPAYRQSPDAFLAVKGERALLMGDRRGLEVWAYPLQLVRGYRVRFRVEGEVTAHDGAALLRRVERGATETVRVYVGPDFVVRERLFTPRERPGAIVRYEVEGRPDVRIEAAFQPSLDLMWPGALGGQSVEWSPKRSAYLEREPLHGFVAAIASAEATAHDPVLNRTRPVDDDLRMVLTPRGAPGAVRTAAIYFGLDREGDGADAGEAERLRAGEEELRRDAAAHVAAVMAGSTRITTPDEDVNRALGSAALALDRAWACSDAIGCGALAGFGPSRRGRRPQYAWFFAGDGLVAMQGMLAAGQHERARAELELIARWQDRRTGMIWHEISQSAGLIDWRGKYHYMFVHVDITLQYLAALDDYLATTGDLGFVRKHWAGIVAAYRYARSIVDPATGVPRIPEGKQGPNEQDALRDDVRLSTAWIDAADGFARLARRMGKAGPAREAERAAARARAALAADGWDEARGFWLSGHTAAGAPVHDERPDAIGVLTQGAFSPAQVARVVDRLATPDFLTDWGIRNLSARDPRYDPNLYGSGSVWGLGTAAAARTFWSLHRASLAWPLWRGMAEGNTLESAGHLHEVLAGDLYHPEFESVPEQTWSSAGLLIAAARGMLGLEPRPGNGLLVFRPHLPGGWDAVAVERVAVGPARIDLRLERVAAGYRLVVTNPGAPVAVDFAPVLPVGARLGEARVNGAAAAVAREDQGTDAHARLRFTAAAGRTEVVLPFEGGTTVEPVLPPLREGEASRAPKLVGVREEGDALLLDAWLLAPGSAFELRTSRTPASAEGARIEAVAPGRYQLVADRPVDAPRRAAIRVRWR